MTKASPQAVTAVLLLGTRGPERAEGGGQTKRGGWYVRRGETLGFFSPSLSCLKRKKKKKEGREKQAKGIQFQGREREGHIKGK